MVRWVEWCLWWCYWRNPKWSTETLEIHQAAIALQLHQTWHIETGDHILCRLPLLRSFTKPPINKVLRKFPKRWFPSYNSDDLIRNGGKPKSKITTGVQCWDQRCYPAGYLSTPGIYKDHSIDLSNLRILESSDSRRIATGPERSA